jgi:hypothetical protein
LATGVLYDLPDLTQRDYDALMGQLGLDDDPPEGGILHVAGPHPAGGWLILDVWDSVEAFDRFAHERLLPAARGLRLTISRPRVFPVHNVFAPDFDFMRTLAASARPLREWSAGPNV